MKEDDQGNLEFYIKPKSPDFLKQIVHTNESLSFSPSQCDNEKSLDYNVNQLIVFDLFDTK